MVGLDGHRRRPGIYFQDCTPSRHFLGQCTHCGQLILEKISTRKLSYRKNYRAMRPVYECLKNFGSPGLCPRLLFNGLFFRLMLRICVQNLKFVASRFTRSCEIIAIGVLGGVANPQSWGRAGVTICWQLEFHVLTDKQTG